VQRKAVLAHQLAERLRYEEGIASCSRSLIEGGPRAIGSALGHLREAAGASRVYLFENFLDPADGLCIRQTHEACAPGVKPEIDNPALLHMSYRSYASAERLLAAGRPFWGLVAELEPEMQELLRPQGIFSILNIPVNVEGAWYGFIGFDDTAAPRRWSDDDVRLLQTAAEMIGVHIARERNVGELARGKAKLDKIFLTVPCGIGMVIDRVFTEVNDRLCQITGYAPEDLLGRKARILYESDGEYERVGRETLAKIERDGTGATETRWRRSDGTMVDILLSSSPLKPGHLQEDFLFAVLDITERAAAERERRLVEEQMQHVARLESLGVLAGGIAHDFNNLLMIVLGNLELASSEPTLPPAVRKNPVEMGTAARHGAELTRQLLAYAGRGRLVLQRLDLSRVIEEMRDIIAVTVGKRAIVDYDLMGELPSVETDLTQVRQVIMNLVTNAVESISDAGGRVSVRTGRETLDAAALERRILGGGAPPGPFVFVEVSDTGTGIDPQTMGKIFDPFYSTKFIGRGLGLPAVHGIVRSHRGCILVVSEPARGSTFRVSLPVALPGR
jgi:PAS domain S-box-containing protein